MHRLVRRTAPAAALALGAPLLLSVPPGSATGITHIGFDDAPAACSFVEATALRGRYAAAKFSGPGVKHGGAILNNCAGFGVTARTGSQFLAFRSDLLLADGGIPKGPETIRLTSRQKSVAIWVNKAGGPSGQARFTLKGKRAGKTLKTSSVAVETNTWTQLKVKASGGFASVVVSASDPDGIWLADDLLASN